MTTPTVYIEVRDGITDIISCPKSVEVKIVDYDCLPIGECPVCGEELDGGHYDKDDDSNIYCLFCDTNLTEASQKTGSYSGAEEEIEQIKKANALFDDEIAIQEEMLRGLIQMEGPNDYVFNAPEEPDADRRVWITVDNLSVSLARTDEGVVVDIYPLHSEMEDAITSTYAFFAEAYTEEELVDA